MKKKICVVTGTRAEYGLLRGVMEEIARADNLTLQVVVTGMHLSPEFGMTAEEVARDFRIDRRVEILLSSDSPVGTAKSMGLGLVGFADALRELAPDLIVILGDRFEIFAVAGAATALGIPIAHIHGGETTEGAIDEAFRHSITKMSHLHFTATERYRRRVIQMGEAPERVYCVGAPGLDAVARLSPLPEREELEAFLGISLGQRAILVTFHPVTLEEGHAGEQARELLKALARLPKETRLIFTKANADAGGREINRMLEAFTAERPNTVLFDSLGQRRYFGLLKEVDMVVGNSSSGLIEVPAFKIPTVNIGDRQSGRERGESVIDVAPRAEAIYEAIQKAYDPAFRERIKRATNPYGFGGSAKRIVDVLQTRDFADLLKKRFYDLEECLENLRTQEGAIDGY